MKKIVKFLVAFVVLTACNQMPVINIRTEAESIRKTHDQWQDAIKTNDIDKYMSTFAPGAVAMNANSTACVGLPAIRKSLETWFSDTTNLLDTSNRQ